MLFAFTHNMKRNTGKYDTVDTLPANAISVPQYAKNKGFTPQYVYNKIANKKADFKIVIFQGYNFVIPE